MILSPRPPPHTPLFVAQYFRGKWLGLQLILSIRHSYSFTQCWEEKQYKNIVKNAKWCVHLNHESFSIVHKVQKFEWSAFSVLSQISWKLFLHICQLKNYATAWWHMNRKIKASQPTKVRYKPINKTKHLCNR